MALLDDLSDILSTGGITRPIFKIQLPAQAADSAVLLSPLGGQATIQTMAASASNNHAVEQPTVRVTCRDKDYSVASAVAHIAFRLVDGFRATTVNGVPYLWMAARSSPRSLGTDNNARSVVGFDLDIMRGRQGYAQAVLDDGATGYWRLGDAIGSLTASDSSGGGHSGTVNSVVTFGQAGSLSAGDTAALFVANGSGGGDTGGYLTAPMSALGTAWTLEGWHKRAGSSASERELLSFAGGDVEVFVNTSETVIRVAYGGATRITGVVNVCDGNWHHVAVVCNGVNSRLYIDGVQDSSTFVGTANISATAINIGRYYAGGFTLDASLDEVAIYATALSSTQVAAHYALRTSPVH